MVESEILVPPIPVREELDSLYPLETDEPVASSAIHHHAMDYARDAMAYQLRREECLVEADYAFYYRQLEQGEPGPGPSVTPDVMVVLGYTAPRARSYRLWEAGRTPDLVMEMSSESTHRQDQFFKHELYADLGIREYWMYDPHGGYLEPRLQGFSLEEGRYLPVDGELRADLEAEVFFSAVLGTFWGRLLGTDDLRLWIAAREEWFLPTGEREAARDRQTERADSAERQRDRATERADSAERQRDRATERAYSAERQRDREIERADSAERQRDREAAERARLEREVSRLQGRLGKN